MKNKFLFPFPCKIAGLILLPVFIVLLCLWMNDRFTIALLQYKEVQQGSLSSFFEDGNYTNELIFGGLLLSLILMAFSRERVEDERTVQVRLQSLHLTHYINYAILALWIFLTDGLEFVISAICLPYIFLGLFLVIYHIRLYVIPRLFAF